MSDNAQKEDKRRKKMLKKMRKILMQAWQHPGSDPFQETGAHSLKQVGQAVEDQVYLNTPSHRQGWEDFARDLGIVYNHHISRTTKHSKAAKEHLLHVQEVLGQTHESLKRIAGEAKPTKKRKEAPTAAATLSSSSSAGDGKRRRSAENGNNNNNKNSGGGGTAPPSNYVSTNTNPELAQREVRAMDMLYQFLVDRGGNPETQLRGYRSRVARKRNQPNKFDVHYFSPQQQRFRSMLDVGRHLNLVHDSDERVAQRKGALQGGRRKTGGTKEQQAEKKRIRRELDKLRKTLQRATKALDDHNVAHEEEQAQAAAANTATEDLGAEAMTTTKGPLTRSQCAATLKCDLEGFPGIPPDCIPDVLQAWDFCATFQRSLSLTPMESVDDFGAALAYVPPEQDQVRGDDVRAPPVYLAETHLGLLKLLLDDRTSEDWWWSILETSEETAAVNPITSAATVADSPTSASIAAKEGPAYRINVEALLNHTEEPLITSSWVQPLDIPVTATKSGVQSAIRTALKVVANPWVKVYLRKARKAVARRGLDFTKQAISWLVSLFKPILQLQDPKELESLKARIMAKAKEEIAALGEKGPAITEQEIAEMDDDEEEEEEDEEESDEEEEEEEIKDKDNLPASPIPPRPLPTLVDMLLPPNKPSPSDEYINAFTWSQLVGATAHRILHRKKRVLNEVDDGLRADRELPPLKPPERREREKLAAHRILTECAILEEGQLSKAIEHLCQGRPYLELGFVERLCILRLLIEAAYDTDRLYEVVDKNYKDRSSAMKALEVEQRKAKKDAKEKALADEAAARQRLTEEAKEVFLDEKREEIRKLNENSHGLTDDVIEALTDEEILDFDEDYKADYEALPGPDTFNKAQVTEMVTRMHEEAAFETDALKVLTLEEVADRDKVELEEMEGQLVGFGGENAAYDMSLDRETLRSIERLRRDIDKAKNLAERLPEMRERAMEGLKDAMADGTMKVLKAAITAAKRAKLQGVDEETGGVWAVDLLRDAALELEKAKQNKKVADARKDLIAKRNRCFIRTEPLGRDRFGNRFWAFDYGEDGHVWVDSEFTLKDDSGADEESEPPSGFLDMRRSPTELVVGANDMEEQLMDDETPKETFEKFSRKEYHSAGFSAALVKNHWGCQATEESLRGVIKHLDSKSSRERELKTQLKEAVENKAGTGEKQEPAEEKIDAGEDEPGSAVESAPAEKTSGDENVLHTVKQDNQDHEDVRFDGIDEMQTAIGRRVRVRVVVTETKDSVLAKYESGTVTSWKMGQEERKVVSDESDEDEMDFDPRIELVDVPEWKVVTDRGYQYWVHGRDLLESMARYDKLKSGLAYYEQDAVFLGYRNALGKHCGRPSDAPYASSPISFARLMVKKESEYYPKLKIRSYDNSWGGKSGARALWTNSMKDYAFDLATVRQGLLTLENAFFDLTGEWSEYQNLNLEKEPDAQVLLDNPAARSEIELESIETDVAGLWNSPASRAVFIEIVSKAKSTGLLALALDLLCRNTMKYLEKHKLHNVRTQTFTDEILPPRTTRRRNAWQQANHDDWF